MNTTEKELNELIDAKVETILQLKEKEKNERRSKNIMRLFITSFLGALPLIFMLLVYFTEAAYGRANNLSMGFMLGIYTMFFILMTSFAIKSYLEAN
jgi:glycerol uptake facilitator-like aquaporin